MFIVRDVIKITPAAIGAEQTHNAIAGGKAHTGTQPATASLDDLYDQQIAEGMGPRARRRGLGAGDIDRVLERGRLLRLDGPSVRPLHVNLGDALKDDSDQQLGEMAVCYSPVVRQLSNQPRLETLLVQPRFAKSFCNRRDIVYGSRFVTP